MSTRLWAAAGTCSASNSANTRTRRPNTIVVCNLPTRVMDSAHKLFQELLALPQRSASFGERAFVGPVFHFDAHRAIVAGVGKRREQRSPGNVAKAGQLRRVPAQAHDADIVELRRIDACVLRMKVDNSLAEFTDAGHAFDMLPDQMRWIEVEPPARARYFLEHRPPDRGSGGQIGASRPFVEGEQHRAIFDSQRDAGLFGTVNQPGPNLIEQGPIFGNRFLRIASNKCIDDMDSQPWRRRDDFLQMVNESTPMIDLGMQRIGIISKSRDCDLMSLDKLTDALRFGVAQVRDIDVRDARVAPIGFARRPAHEFNTAEALVGGKF